MCAACKGKPLRSALAVKAQGDEVVLASGERARQVGLEGAFRIKPDGAAKDIEAAGVWKLEAAHGGIRVLLSLDSERYVALALRGEAAAKEPIESLKAMAIAVRTFALENADRHRSEGFNLCDSTHCQVLKFGTASPLVEQAVHETAGETLWFGAQRARVFYTQNCGGQSEAARSAWPGTGAPYLVSHRDPWCTREGAAGWHAEVTTEQIRNVFRQEGWKPPGRIDAVRVVQRTDAGRAEKVAFIGDGTTVPVTASSLRFALDRVLGWNQLRSEWYTVSFSDGVLRFDGRGYGHGVGLCQAGATAMAAAGHSAAEVLSFYFPGTRVGVTAQDRGWQSTGGRGWMLWTTADSAELLREGNAAWGKAETLYPPHAAVQPEVWEYPTTELFRQATHEPGWMLASTQGARVFLQPEPILKKGGGDDDTLLHEFLHVLVESEASPQAPLWLREGVVEALAEGGSAAPHAPGAPVHLANVDAALARPASQMESQRAHAAAASLADALIARYGLEQVRQWLRAGSVPPAVTTMPAPGAAAGRIRVPSTPQ